MSHPAPPRRRVVVAVDMEQYSPRDNLRQFRAQQLFREVMHEAVTGIGLRREDWTTQQSGDGELAVLPADTSELTVVAELVPALDRILREHNRHLLPEAKVRLRVAIHQGLVHLTGANGFPGEAVVEVNRLLDAEPLRHALQAFPQASVALIVSGGIFRDIVRHGYDGLRPDRFAPVQVKVKHFESEAWIFVPDENANARPATTAPPSTKVQPAENATYTFNGVTTHGPAVFGPGGTAIGTVHGTTDRTWP